MERAGDHYKNRKLARAERAALMRELTAVLAHQINQPLASVAASGQAALQWLSRAEPEVGEALRSLRRILEHKDRAADTIGEVRAAVCALTPASQEVLDLTYIVDVARLAVAEDLQAIGARMEVEGNLGPIYLRLSAVELELALIQLLRNAIEAMATAETRLLTVRLLMNEEGVSVEVVDTGAGVQADDADQVFDLFFTRKPGAEGVGLSVCRSIATHAGGRLGLTCSSQQGSTFRMELPFGEDRDVSAVSGRL